MYVQYVVTKFTYFCKLILQRPQHYACERFCSTYEQEEKVKKKKKRKGKKQMQQQKSFMSLLFIDPYSFVYKQKRQ